MDKVSFEQNPAGSDGSRGRMFQERKRQVKRSCAWHFQSIARRSRKCGKACMAGSVRGGWEQRRSDRCWVERVMGQIAEDLVDYRKPSAFTEGGGEISS